MSSPSLRAREYFASIACAPIVSHSTRPGHSLLKSRSSWPSSRRENHGLSAEPPNEQPRGNDLNEDQRWQEVVVLHKRHEGGRARKHHRDVDQVEDHDPDQ